MKHWRLHIERPSEAPQSFDFQGRFSSMIQPGVSLGHAASNHICLESASIPNHLKVLTMGLKGPRLKLTEEIETSLTGKFVKGKSWKSALYQGHYFHIESDCQWMVADARFDLKQIETLAALPPAERNALEDKKEFFKAAAYACGAYLGAILLIILLYTVNGFFHPRLEVTVQPQKISVVALNKIFEKPKAVEAPPVETPSKPEVQQLAMAQPTAPKAVEVQQKHKAVRASHTAAAHPSAAKKTVAKPIGLLAVAGRPVHSSAQIPTSFSQPKSDNRATALIAAGLGVSDNHLGIAQVAAAPERLNKGISASSEGYGGGLSDQVRQGASKGLSVELVRREVEVRGALDPAVIRQIIEERLSEVRYCYERALLKENKLSGKVAASWTISPDGSVTDFISNSTEISATILQPCLKTQIQKWKFPAPKGGGLVRVKYPFVFNPVGG